MADPLSPELALASRLSGAPEAGREYQPVLESITRLALDPGLGRPDLLRALAENLAALNQGFALLECDFKRGELRVEAAYAADGTSYPLGKGTARRCGGAPRSIRSAWSDGSPSAPSASPI